MANHWRFENLLLARMIHAKRAAKQMTLRDVAQRTGVAASTVMRMEQGKAADIDSLVAVCEWLEMSLDGFVWRGNGNA